MLQRTSILFLVAAVHVATGHALAQVTTGTIVGTVRDADGVIPGAAVTIREVNRGTSNTYQTDETGSYTALFLSDGGVLGAIVGGWQLAGIGTTTTGRPFTVFMQNGVNNGAPSWPNRIGSGKLEDPSVDRWYNPLDFQAPPPNTYGNTGRGILYGPGHINFDTSLSKRFTVAGRANAEFRWDAFNPVQPPGLRLPQPELRFADRGAHHYHGRRQPFDAVLNQVQFLTCDFAICDWN